MCNSAGYNVISFIAKMADLKCFVDVTKVTMCKM